MKENQKPFWETKALSDMSVKEWELLCDHCGQCCLYKIENELTHVVLYSSVACKYLDTETCRCQIYEQRLEKAPDCIKITANEFNKIYLLPESCSYRCLYEKRELPAWHHLISGNSDLVHNKGISVKGKIISARDIHPDDLEAHLLEDD